MADDAASLPKTAPRAGPTHAQPVRRRFVRAEFQAMIAAGVIAEGSRVELLGGDIVDMAGEGYAHSDGVAALARILAAIGQPVREVLMRCRLDVDEDSECYPDLMVQTVGVLTRDRSPENVHLIVEVSETTLAFDRDAKGPRYAAAGYDEYWIYEPTLRRITVHREPMPDGRWGLIFVREGEASLSPLFAPEAVISIPILPAESA
jgi:Uma2 family endonuclease